MKQKSGQHARYRWGLRLIHDALLAAVISALVYVLELSGYVRSIDESLLFQFNSQIVDIDASRQLPASPALSPNQYPQVILIPSELERGRDFKLQLAQLISSVAKHSPLVIAVSLVDVGPASRDPNSLPTLPSDDPASARRGAGAPESLREPERPNSVPPTSSTSPSQPTSDPQENLNLALDQAAGAKIKIVLVLPSSILGDPDGKDPDSWLWFDWLVKRCKAGVHFAGDEQRWREEHLAAASSYFPQFPSLGVMANALSSGNPTFDICAIAMTVGRNRSHFLDRIKGEMPGAFAAWDSRSLNPEFFAVQSHIRRYGPQPGTILHPETTYDVDGDLPTNAVVLIGNDDKRLWTYGERQIPWVQLFAAEAFSEAHSISAISTRWAFVIDTVFGVMLGFLFASTWGKYAVLAAQLEATPLLRWREKMRAYFYARGMLAFNIVLLPVILFGVLRISESLLQKGLWLNPIPVAGAMFLDALLRSRRKAVEPVATTLPALFNQHPDIPLQVLFLAGVAVYASLFR